MLGARLADSISELSRQSVSEQQGAELGHTLPTRF